MSEKYVVIAERKDEEPLIFETYLSAASYEACRERMGVFANNPSIVRVAIARLVYVTGNKSLIREEEA
jgi:hypothetical protein